MPIYMDRHFTEGATQHALADAHEKDINIQDKFNVKFITYWFDEKRSTAFCLVDAPNKEALQNAHNEAHGNVAHEIIEVDPSIVESFLGRVKDPTPSEKTDNVSVDSAFRIIMFTDLKDSTKMTSQLGDTKALNLIHVHNALTRNELKKYNGNEIKHTGDGIMASFVLVQEAILCAISIQKAFDTHNSTHQDKHMSLKIGLSAGEPIEEHGDLFGKSVQLSARLCSHAQANQILASQEIYDLSEKSKKLFSKLDTITPKGFEKPLNIYRIHW